MDIAVTSPRILPLTWLRFIASFQARDDWSRRRLRKAIRYTLLSLSAPRAQACWLALLDSQEAFRLARARDPRLLERWQHRSINLHLWTHQRLALLIGHHQRLVGLLPARQLLSLYRDGELALAEVEMKNKQPLQLLLALPVLKGHEGELNLVVRSTPGSALYTMTVTLDPTQGRLLIGCLQGPASEHGLGQVKEITRQCHGLRPKNLLLSAAFELARLAGLQRVLGVSNQAHAWSRRRRVSACYDSFWLESGGRLGTDGFFDLGQDEPLRSEQDVCSKRRSAFRQREALRQALLAQLAAALEPHVWPGPLAAGHPSAGHQWP